MMFFIFGAQEEVFEVWTSWYCHIPRPPNTETGNSGRTSTECPCLTKNYPPQPKRLSKFRQSILSIKTDLYPENDVESGVPLDVTRKRRSSGRTGDGRMLPSLPSLPRKILLRPLSAGLPSPTHTPNSSTDTSTTISLPPPPRPARSRSASPDVTQILIINGPPPHLRGVRPYGTRNSFDMLRGSSNSRGRNTVERQESGVGRSHLTTETGRRPGSSSRRPDTAQSRRPDTAQSRRPDTGQSRRPDTGQSRRPDTGQSRRPDTAQSRGRPDTAQSRRPDTAQSSRTFGTNGTIGTLTG